MIDWRAELMSIERRIVEIEERASGQKLKVQQLLEQKKDVTAAEKLLRLFQNNLEYARNHKNFIETRLAERPTHSQPSRAVEALPQIAPGQLAQTSPEGVRSSTKEVQIKSVTVQPATEKPRILKITITEGAKP